MTRIIYCFFLVPIFITILTTADTSHSPDGAKVVEDFQIISPAVESYLNALETFDTTSNLTFRSSCQSLTEAIKAVVESTGVQANRRDQLTAPLFVFPNLRRHIFVDVQYRIIYKNDGSFRIGQMDLMIQRKDGLLFAFSMTDPDTAVKLLSAVEEEDKHESGRFFRLIKRPVPHWVLVCLRFIKHRQKVKEYVASFLLDNYDQRNLVNVSVYR